MVFLRDVMNAVPYGICDVFIYYLFYIIFYLMVFYGDVVIAATTFVPIIILYNNKYLCDFTQVGYIYPNLR